MESTLIQLTNSQKRTQASNGLTVPRVDKSDKQALWFVGEISFLSFILTFCLFLEQTYCSSRLRHHLSSRLCQRTRDSVGNCREYRCCIVAHNVARQ